MNITTTRHDVAALALGGLTILLTATATVAMAAAFARATLPL